MCMPFLGNLAFPLTLNASLCQGRPLLSAEITPQYSRHLIPVLSGRLADMLGQAGSNMNSWAPSRTPPAQTCLLVPFSTDGNSNLEVRPEDLGASLTPLVAQAVENLPTMQETWVGKIPWKREWQHTQVFLPGEPHGQRSLRGCSLWGCKELDTT